MIKGIYPYLVMNGNGQEAVKFYESALDAKVTNVQTFGDNPEMSIPEEEKHRVLNAQLKVGDADLMLSDTFPGNPYQIGSQVTIAITITDPKKTEEVFSKLADGGNVGMPLQETFWSPAFGMVTDKFGVTWQVSTEMENS